MLQVHLIIKVGKLTAMNGTSVMGRSYAYGNYSYNYKYRGNTITINSSTQAGTLYGRNFQQQWDYAINLNPNIVLVTGWNEWIASRQESWQGVSNAFPDQFNDEYSRDIEPSKGSLKDTYYYQLVSNIRRFKGTVNNKATEQSTKKTINIKNGTDQWNDSNIITYNHYTNNTAQTRNSKQWGTESDVTYTNSTFRNDIKTSKVAYDGKNIYFYVETNNNLTRSKDDKWMRLLIDTVDSTDNTSDKNWKEFEYIVNRETASNTTMELERSTGGWNWEKIGDVNYTANGKVLQIEIPRAYLGQDGSTIKFNFKWADNNLTDGDIMTVYNDGDTAPGGRFAFSFTGKNADFETNTLTINPNGGQFNGNSGNTTLKLRYGTSDYCSIGQAKRDNFTFLGYYSAASGGEKVYDSNGNCVNCSYWNNKHYLGSGDLAVYAHWQANSITEKDYSYTPTGWTNQDVVATFTFDTDITNPNINGWNLSSDKRKLTKTYTANTTENSFNIEDTTYTIIAKTKKITITNIDRQAPTNTQPTATSTTNSINITCNQTDSESGIKSIQYSIDGGKTWQNNNTFTGLAQNKTYTIETKVTDNAGNVTTSQALNVTTKKLAEVEKASASPTNWINEKVTITLPTVNGLTTKYTTDGSTPTTVSATYSVPFEVKNNCTIKYIYTDGMNTNTPGTLTITNIDKQAPTNTAPEATSVTADSITLMLKQTDSESGIDESKTKYRLLKDKEGKTEARTWQTSPKFSNLTKNTSYYLQSEVTDKAGNTTTSLISENSVSLIASSDNDTNESNNVKEENNTNSQNNVEPNNQNITEPSSQNNTNLSNNIAEPGSKNEENKTIIQNNENQNSTIDSTIKTNNNNTINETKENLAPNPIPQTGIAKYGLALFTICGILGIVSLFLWKRNNY